jgi:lantibiotic modifying enzyme
MTELFEPQRHEQLAVLAWDETQVRNAIAAIAARAQSAAANGIWGGSSEAGSGDSQAHRSLYSGLAGVLWALQRLAARNLAPSDAPKPIAALLQRATTLRPTEPSYLIGDSGVLLALYDAAPAAAISDALYDTVVANHDNPALELMWGAPGTMLAALAMYQQTGEERWSEAFRVSVDAMEANFVLDAELAAHIWTQDLYGSRLKYLGLVHGFAGGAFALIKGRELLEDAAWRRWSHRLASTLRASAARSGDRVNWFAGVSPHRPGRIMPVQACHGAPGMVIGLADLPEPIDDLLVAAGELTWAAGPLTKGACLCHGTAGNGYAFLKLYKRTGDFRWLDRARAFAMHAIAQVGREVSEGPERHALWTGDLGLAVYLADCLTGAAQFPTLDD